MNHRSKTTPHRVLGFWLAFLVVGVAAYCHAAEDSKAEALAVIERAAGNYQAYAAFDYRVQLKSAEIEKLIAEKLASQYHVQVKPAFALVNVAEKEAVIKPELESLTEPYRSVAENKINQHLGVFLTLLAALNSQTVSTGLRICHDSARFDIIQNDDKVLDIELNELNEPMFAKNIRGIRLRIDRAKGIVEKETVSFGPGQNIEMNLSHLPQELPGGQKVYVLGTVHVRQTTFTKGEAALPPEFSFRFEDYRFEKKKDSTLDTGKNDSDVAFYKWKAALDQIGLADRLVQHENGLYLNLNAAPITDLSPLKGMRLALLDLANTKVKDLTPLKGMPLTWLSLMLTPVSDLGPLAGMPLRNLVIVGSSVADLSPLKGMPLTELDARASQVSDLSPLQGMGLTWLDVSATSVTNVAPLIGMPLVYLSLSSGQITDINPLRDLPLKKLSLIGSPITDLTPLKGMQLELLDLGAAYSLTDISSLQGMPLKILGLHSTKVTDLSVLQSMPLESLDLRVTQVSDLSPLKGTPLKDLLLNNCAKLQDLSPLAECKQLERLILPVQCTEIAFLRQLPRLKRLSYEFTEGNWDKVSTAEEFWKKLGSTTELAKTAEAEASTTSKETAESKPNSQNPQPSVEVSDTVDLVELSKSRDEWPAEVSLTQKVSVPVVINGKAYGSTDLTAGTTLRVLQIRGTKVLVTKGTTTNTVPASATDLVARVVAARKTQAAKPTDN